MGSMFERPVMQVSWRQLGALTLDGSSSMLQHVDAKMFSGTKGEAVGLAVRDLIGRLGASAKAANFTFAGTVFADRVTDTWGPVPVPDLDGTADRNPTLAGGIATSLAAGLESAHRQVTSFLDAGTDGLPSSAVILLLTDGECGTPDATRRVAEQIKWDDRIRIACAFFATRGQPPRGLELLQEICSAPAGVYCKTVYDPESLREFFQASLTLPASVPVDGWSR